MNQIEFKVKVTLINNRFASKKNIKYIFAISSELCTNVHGYGIDPKTYYERWEIRKEKEGYIWREVTHNGGINGHHKTLRLLLIRSCGYRTIKIVFIPPKDTLPAQEGA